MTEDTLAIVKAINRLTEEVRAIREGYGSAPAELLMADEPTVCAHPTDARVSFATSGNDDFHCKACNQMVACPLSEVPA